MHLNGEDGMALQRLAARYRPAALRQPHLQRGSSRWAVDLEPGGKRRRAKTARHGRRTTQHAERERTGPFPWENGPKNPEALRAPLKVMVQEVDLTPERVSEAERLWHDGARLLVPGQLPIVHCRAPGPVGGGQLACSVQPGAEVPCHLHR